MTPVPWDRIRLLLIDDEPESLCKVDFPSLEALGSGSPRAAEILDEARQAFELKWIATAAEAREFRDLSRRCLMASDQAYKKGAWVPEVILFDYALSGQPESLEDRGLTGEHYSELSPLPSMRRLAGRLGVDCPPPGNEPDTGAEGRSDNMGCFAGGLIFTFFSDHPTAPVAFTRKTADSMLRTEATFFEWMLENEAMGTFDQKHRTQKYWDVLLVQGVRSFRKRLEQLTKAGLVTPNLKELLALSEDGSQEHVLSIDSMFGTRRLPIDGLFLDHRKGKERRDAAREWAVSLSEDILRPIFRAGGGQKQPEPAPNTLQAVADLRSAVRVADDLWAAYTSELVEHRHRLSELYAAANDKARPLTKEETEEFKKLADDFGVDLPVKKGAHCSKPGMVFDLRHATPARVRRWAALFLTVRLCGHATRARKDWDLALQGTGLSSRLDPVLAADIAEEDLYLALFPVPERPIVLPCHRAKQSGGSAWGQILRRDNMDDPSLPWKAKKPKEFKNLGLDLRDVLAGSPWCEDDASSEGKWTHGLFPGEKPVLRMYARSLGMEHDEQPEWLSGPGDQIVLVPPE